MMVVVEVVGRRTIPGTVDRVTTRVVLLYVWSVARHGCRVVPGSGVGGVVV